MSLIILTRQHHLENASKKFHAFSDLYKDDANIYAVTYTASFKNVDEAQKNLYLQYIVQEFQKNTPFKLLLVKEFHKNGLPHYHGLLASPKGFPVIQYHKENYPYQYKLKPITDFDGWTTYCLKTFTHRKKREITRTAKRAVNKLIPVDDGLYQPISAFISKNN